jgi:two-component system, NarL family, response regulator NreC
MLHYFAHRHNRENAVEKIEIAIADDHVILRAGVRMLVNAQSDMRIVAEGGSVPEILVAIQNIEPDVLLLDIGLTGGSGLVVLKQVRIKRPMVKVIMLTMHNDVSLMRSAVAEGASGFVLKQAADTDLLSAIRAVYKGGMFIDTSLAAAFMAEKANAPGGSLVSRREKQVIQLLAHGYSNQEIARHLYISVKTVETYKARIAEKLGFHSRKEITRYAVLTGLLRPEDFSLDERLTG